MIANRYITGDLYVSGDSQKFLEAMYNLGIPSVEVVRIDKGDDLYSLIRVNQKEVPHKSRRRLGKKMRAAIKEIKGTILSHYVRGDHIYILVDEPLLSPGKFMLENLK